MEEERADDVFRPEIDGQMKRVSPLAVSDVGVGAGVDEGGHAGRMGFPGLDGSLEERLASVIGGVDVHSFFAREKEGQDVCVALVEHAPDQVGVWACTCGNERRDDRRVSLSSGKRERRFPVDGAGVHVCLCAQELVDNLEMVVLGGKVERGPHFLV